MNIQGIFVAGLLVLSSASVSAEPASRITRVTLYPGAATVERVAHVAAGATHLDIAGLPANFDPQTIRVEGGTGIRIGEVSVQDATGTEAASAREAELETKLQALDDKIGQIEAERKASELVTGYLQSLGAKEGAAKGTAPQDAKNLSAMLDAIHRGGAESFARIQKLQMQKADVERQKQAVQSELDLVRSGAQDTRRQVSIGLAAERAGDVRISYLVNGPGWRPSYRASLDSNTNQVDLERLATIAQSSGEDWKNVSLRLSTGQPRQSPQGREIMPWRLSIQRPVVMEPMSRVLAAPAPASAPMAKLAREASAPLLEIAELQTGFATEFEVPGQVSLPADGRQLTVSLAHQRLAVKVRVQVAPRQDTTAYVVAEAQAPEGVWLPGNIQLVRDGSHIGATYWNPQKGDALQLPFGRDDLVRVTVAHVQAKSGESGLISQRNERHIQDRYTVENRHKQAVNLLLLEASPQSEAEQIKVQASFQPKPSRENWNDKAGVVAWEQTLAAGDKQTFNLDYQISWPKDALVNGLP